MRATRQQIALAVAVVLAMTACDPLFVLRGGALDGDEYPAPDDWTFAADEDVVQLEARPSDPYSVNLWGVGVGPHYYVASASDASWAAMVAEDPRVRLRIAGRIYPLAATPVADAAELDAVVAAYVAKYDVEAEDDFPRNVAVFRLAPR